MQLPDINTMEIHTTSLEELSSMELLDILKDIDFLEVYYVNETAVIRRKDRMKEEFHV